MKTSALNAIQTLRQPPIGKGGIASLPKTFFKEAVKIKIQPAKIVQSAADPHAAGLINPTIRESAGRLVKTIYNSLAGKK